MEKVSINFKGKNLTGNSGLIPIAQFAEELKVEETLRGELSSFCTEIPKPNGFGSLCQ